jgi:CheY-like chemotaxis protein
VTVVLIVEDDTQVRMLAEAVLQGAGYETRSASTRAEAQAFFASDQCRLQPGQITTGGSGGRESSLSGLSAATDSSRNRILASSCSRQSLTF